jgi:Domain of unknown function (DUF4397)
MKKLILSFSVLATVALFSACTKSSDNGPVTTASVMFVNGSTGSTPENAEANGTAISGASNIAFLGSSGYQNITAGSSVSISLILASSNLTLGSSSISLTAGDNYSVFSGGAVNSPAFMYTNDDLSAPPTGQTKIRLINLSPDSLSLTGSLKNINTGDTATLASGIGRINTSTSVSAFTSIAAGTYKLVVADPLNYLGTSAPLQSQIFNAGKIYTVIYTGIATGTGTSAYTLTVINNN